MNQFDSLIKDYFIETGEVSIEKIGYLSKGGDDTVHEENTTSDKSIVFRFDKKAVTSQGLIEFVSQKTGKSKTLVEVDLDSHLELMRQFLNIGKIYEIDGLGGFKISMTGAYEFLPIDETKKKDETKTQKKQKQQEAGIYAPKKTNSNKSALMLFAIVIILAVIGIIGWGAYKLFVSGKAVNNTDTTAVTTNPVILPDTTLSKNDSLLKDSLAGSLQPVNSDSGYYKFIFETTTSLNRARSRKDSLVAWGSQVMYDSVKTDTITYYKLYFKLRANVTDTSRIRDSLATYVGRKIKIE